MADRHNNHPHQPRQEPRWGFIHNPARVPPPGPWRVPRATQRIRRPSPIPDNRIYYEDSDNDLQPRIEAARQLPGQLMSSREPSHGLPSDTDPRRISNADNNCNLRQLPQLGPLPTSSPTQRIRPIPSPALRSHENEVSDDDLDLTCEDDQLMNSREPFHGSPSNTDPHRISNTRSAENNRNLRQLPQPGPSPVSSPIQRIRPIPSPAFRSHENEVSDDDFDLTCEMMSSREPSHGLPSDTDPRRISNADNNRNLRQLPQPGPSPVSSPIQRIRPIPSPAFRSHENEVSDDDFDLTCEMMSSREPSHGLPSDTDPRRISNADNNCNLRQLPQLGPLPTSSPTQRIRPIPSPALRSHENEVSDDDFDLTCEMMNSCQLAQRSPSNTDPHRINNTRPVDNNCNLRQLPQPGPLPVSSATQEIRPISSPALRSRENEVSDDDFDLTCESDQLIEPSRHQPTPTPRADSPEPTVVVTDILTGREVIDFTRENLPHSSVDDPTIRMADADNNGIQGPGKMAEFARGSNWVELGDRVRVHYRDNDPLYVIHKGHRIDSESTHHLVKTFTKCIHKRISGFHVLCPIVDIPAGESQAFKALDELNHRVASGNTRLVSVDYGNPTPTQRDDVYYQAGRQVPLQSAQRPTTSHGRVSYSVASWRARSPEPWYPIPRSDWVNKMDDVPITKKDEDLEYERDKWGSIDPKTDRVIITTPNVHMRVKKRKGLRSKYVLVAEANCRSARGPRTIASILLCPVNWTELAYRVSTVYNKELPLFVIHNNQRWDHHTTNDSVFNFDHYLHKEINGFHVLCHIQSTEGAALQVLDTLQEAIDAGTADAMDVLQYE